MVGSAAGIIPFGVLSTLVLPEFMCTIPLSNIGVSIMNMVFLYLFFARHQASAKLDPNLLKFTEQELYKHYVYMLLNILSIGLELPYMFGACFNFVDRESPLDKVVSYGEMLH